MATIKLRQPTKEEKNKIFYAAVRGELQTLQELTSSGVDVTGVVDWSGNTPLQLAVTAGRHKTVEYFIKQAKMDITQFDMKTQQTISELVKKAEAEQIKGDNQPGSHDIQQGGHTPTSRTKQPSQTKHIPVRDKHTAKTTKTNGESKKEKTHSPLHSTSSPVQSPCAKAKEYPLTPEVFNAKSLPSSQPHISIVHRPSSLFPSVAASSYEQPVLQNVNEHPSMPKPVKKTQQRINELVKKAEDEKIKGDNQPGSNDIQQVQDRHTTNATKTNVTKSKVPPPVIPYRESKKKKSHSPFHSTSSPVQSPCAKECPLTPEAFDAKSLPSSQPHISIVHRPSSLSPSVAASSYEQPVLQNVNEHPSMPKPVKKTQQRINELVKKAEDEQIKGDNQPGSNDIQQVKDVLLPKSNRDEVISTACKSDEATAQLHHDVSSKLQIHSNPQLTTINTAVHQGVNKRESQQQANAQKGTEKMTMLEKAFAEMQISNEYVKNQLSLTQQQLADVQKANTNLQNQLSLTQQQLGDNQQQLTDVQKTNSNFQNQLSLTQQQLRDAQKANTNLQNQLSLTQQQLGDVRKVNTNLQNQLSLTQQQLGDVQKVNTNLQNQLTLTQQQLGYNQQQLAGVQKANSNLQNQLSLTQQQLLGVQSMMTCSRLWVVSHDQFTIGRELGRGAWATVHETKFRGSTVAAKCLHQLITAPKTRQMFQREMEMALQCQHQHIVSFLGATLEGPPVILMELMDTNLRSAYEQDHIKDHQVSGILYDIASALHFLHTRPDPVIHRDVSSANVLLKAQYNGEWLAKLGDLGTAKIQQQAATAGPGAIAYGAPEAGDFTKHSPKMDVYSYGVLILEVLTKTHPFQMVDALKVKVQKQFPHYHQMVTSCINKQFSDRPTMYNVIQQLDRMKLTKN